MSPQELEETGCFSPERRPRTRATWTVNSTPMPTDAIRMTTGTALSLIPMRPIMPKSSTVIRARTVTCQGAQREGLCTSTLPGCRTGGVTSDQEQRETPGTQTAREGRLALTGNHGLYFLIQRLPAGKGHAGTILGQALWDRRRAQKESSVVCCKLVPRHTCSRKQKALKTPPEQPVKGHADMHPPPPVSQNRDQGVVFCFDRNHQRGPSTL